MTKPLFVARSIDEMFGPKAIIWKKGAVQNPIWLKRENGYDFINIKLDKELLELEKYLAGGDERLAVRPYNLFSTGHDKAQNRKVCLLREVDADNGDIDRVAVIICFNDDIALKVVALVDEYCQHIEGDVEGVQYDD